MEGEALDAARKALEEHGQGWGEKGVRAAVDSARKLATRAPRSISAAAEPALAVLEERAATFGRWGQMEALALVARVGGVVLDPRDLDALEGMTDAEARAFQHGITDAAHLGDIEDKRARREALEAMIDAGAIAVRASLPFLIQALAGGLASGGGD